MAVATGNFALKLLATIEEAMYKLPVVIAFVLAAYGITRAQDFKYTVSTDSVAWNPLGTQTFLCGGNSEWDFAYKIPIGFTFGFCGRNFDSLTVETNGYIVFDNDRNYALTAFSGMGDRVDATGNHSLIGYELSGATGSRVLKIQYLGCGPNRNGAGAQSWQIWLRENGNVEFRIGNGTLRCNTVTTISYDEENEVMDTVTVTQLDSAQTYRIGLLNMNMNTESRGLFITADPAAPTAVTVSENDPEVLPLQFLPTAGRRYVFTPSN